MWESTFRVLGCNYAWGERAGELTINNGCTSGSASAFK